MISESQYWKNDLQKNVEFFHNKLHQTTWREASFAALEKRVMLSCYIVRKLAEANKITKEIFECQVKLYSYKNKGKTVFCSTKSKDNIEGILFNSDRSKKKELYMLKIADFIELLSPIAQCY
ncbi:hypothetical protein, partial [Shewanella sp. SM71]|uniref:hypothetical protein n=1 Tax=Shewanella sp. SM71 TaxID=2912804 RepID=UPI0021D933E2